MSRPTRVLFDAGDYSLSPQDVGGIGLRIAELAETMAEECQVRVLGPAASSSIDMGEAQYVGGVRAWPELLAETDAVLFFDMADRARLEDAVAARRLVISENVAPIEHLEYPSLLVRPDPAAAYRPLVADYQRQLQVSHHFLCRSEVERATLIANLCLTGRLAPRDIQMSRTLAHLVSLVPIGFSDRSASAMAAVAPDPLADFLWTGGIWSFYDPMLLVDAVAVCRDRGRRADTAFLYARRKADNAELVGDLASRIKELRIEDRVTLVDEPLPHDRRDAHLKAARAFISVAEPGAENQTCVRLRLRDSRLHGIPMVVDDFGGTANEVRRSGPGTVLSEATPQALATVLLHYLDDAPRRSGPNPAFRYQTTLQGFLSWLRTTTL
uniref:Putative glycosyltransferase n=1 Tax=Streptomyces sp. NRRL 30471 TaxID=996287 RepID=F2WUD1_9ACTN|nr:putative glycosyltransferase [Streptomyces sp. NRRL 30471]